MPPVIFSLPKTPSKRAGERGPVEISKDYYIYDIDSDEQINIGGNSRFGLNSKPGQSKL
ncbi:MAG: hypothetical protein R2883_04690 [Caldisericia bacterium]